MSFLRENEERSHLKTIMSYNKLGLKGNHTRLKTKTNGMIIGAKSTKGTKAELLRIYNIILFFTVYWIRPFEYLLPMPYSHRLLLYNVYCLYYLVCDEGITTAHSFSA